MPADANLNKTVLHVFKIMDALNAADNSLGVSELTRVTGLPKTTVFRLLGTLEHVHAVTATPNQQYQIGPKLLAYTKSADHQNSLVKVALPFMKEFAATTHENINIGILYENQVLYLHSEEGEQFSLQVNLFPVAPLYCSSMGKIFLTSFSNPELTQYLSQTTLKRRTVNTLTNDEQIRNELQKITQTGLSYDNEEYEYGLTCIAVPLYKDKELIAAASVSGPTSRLKVRGWEYIQDSIVEFGETLSSIL